MTSTVAKAVIFNYICSIVAADPIVKINDIFSDKNKAFFDHFELTDEDVRKMKSQMIIRFNDWKRLIRPKLPKPPATVDSSLSDLTAVDIEFVSRLMEKGVFRVPLNEFRIVTYKGTPRLINDKRNEFVEVIALESLERGNIGSEYYDQISMDLIADFMKLTKNPDHHFWAFVRFTGETINPIRNVANRAY